jgi:ligand-binding sensor protein
MFRSLSVASSAVSSVNVDVIDSGEVGRSAMYIKYTSNNGLRTLAFGTPTMTGESAVYFILCTLIKYATFSEKTNKIIVNEGTQTLKSYKFQQLYEMTEFFTKDSDFSARGLSLQRRKRASI